MSKKDFTNRPNPAVVPAMQFFSVPEAMPEAETAPETKPTTQEKPKADASVERKTKRVNLLMQPSVMEDLQKIATMRRTSVNDLVNTVMKAYAQEERELIMQYNSIFNA